MRTLKRVWLGAVAAAMAVGGGASARIIQPWTFQQLTDKSDLVAIGKPVSTNDTAERISNWQGFTMQSVVAGSATALKTRRYCQQIDFSGCNKYHKYRLCLVLSHQYIDQLSLPVRKAVFGNTGTLISFRIGHSDAEVLQAEFGNEFVARQFVDLDRYDVLVKLIENGNSQQPFRGKTLKTVSMTSGRKTKLIAHSRQRFATQRTIVEAKLNRWLAN